MKIVLPVHHFPPRYTAGAELYTLRLACWLLSHGHDVEVVCIEHIDQGESGELQAVHDHYDGVPVWRLSFNAVHAGDAWSYHNPLLQAWFERHFAQTRPNLVHLQAGYLIGVAPLEAAYAHGIPTVLTLHDYWFLCPRITLLRGDGSLCTKIPDDPAGCAWCTCTESRRYRVPDQLSGGLLGTAMQRVALGTQRNTIAHRRATLADMLDKPDAVIAPSHFLAQQFQTMVDPTRLHVSRYGLDLTPFDKLRRQTSPGVLRIGYLGQIAPHKGVHLLVEAFQQLRTAYPLELHVYGGLDAQPAYARRLQRLANNDTRIRFHGRFSNTHVASILAQLDVTVVPSVWFENSPLAIMEAQAAGTPVITTALGGMAELVRHEVDGLHFAPADAADLARQLQRLVDEPELLEQLHAGVRTPRSIDDEMWQVMAIYDHIVSTPIGQAVALAGHEA